MIRVILLLLAIGRFFPSVIAKHVELEFNISNPSGIMIDRVEDPNDGSIYRFGRLRYSMVTVREEWAGIHVIEDIFTPEETKEMISKAELYSQEHGWSEGRHVDYDIRPTKDLPLRTLYSTDKEFQWIKDRFMTKLFPKYSYYYGLNASFLVIDDLFITKYSSNSMTSLLAPHQDKSPWSFVISLNNDFHGGGTFFPKYQRILKGPVGSALIFHGYQPHGAYKIEKGDRYILAGFLNYGPDTHDQFLTMYDPLYDGHAAAAGFRSGDLITGISYCRVKKNDQQKKKGEEEEEEKVSDVSEPQCKTVAEPEPEIIKKMKRITLKTTDHEWKRYAQSCEQLLPKESITFRVKRSVSDIPDLSRSSDVNDNMNHTIDHSTEL